MGLFKRRQKDNDVDKTIIAAIQKVEDTLSDAKIAASELFKGLDGMQKLGEFSYGTTEKLTKKFNALVIRTNIPVEGKHHFLSITVENNGKITAYGDSRTVYNEILGQDIQRTDTIKAKRGNATPILAYVATEARKNNLIR